jgi:hypothetical protein
MTDQEQQERWEHIQATKDCIVDLIQQQYPDLSHLIEQIDLLTFEDIHPYYGSGETLAEP